jgi:hypothetical protein
VPVRCTLGITELITTIVATIAAIIRSIEVITFSILTF